MKHRLKSLVCLFVLLLTGFTQAQTSTYTVIPIRTVKNLVFLRGTVNSIPGWFLLDTGAESVFLNSALFPFQPGDRHLVLNPFGSVGQAQRAGVCLRLGSQDVCRELDATLTGLDGLDLLLGEPVLGLLGYGYIRDYEWLFDVEQNILYRWPAGKKVESPEGFTLREVLPFEIEGYMPLINSRLSQDKNLRLLFDTGASISLLDDRWLEYIRRRAIGSQNVQVRGAGGEKRSLTKYWVQYLQVGNKSSSDLWQVVLLDLEDKQHQFRKVDGILGADFLFDRLISINLKKRELRFWTRT